MVEFKVGDRVRRARGGSNSDMNIGDVGVVIEIRENGTDLKVRKDGANETYGHSTCNMDLVESNGKSIKVKPIELHIVLQDNCKNNLGIYNSYEGAINSNQSNKENISVYRLVKIAEVSNVRQVKKINPIKNTTKKK